MSQQRPAAVQHYLFEVVIACKDLTIEQRDRLLSGLASHLEELAAEGVDLTTELGSPIAYANELRVAAGLPPVGGTATISGSSSKVLKYVLIAVAVVITIPVLITGLSLTSFLSHNNAIIQSVDLAAKGLHIRSEINRDDKIVVTFESMPHDWIEQDEVGFDQYGGHDGTYSMTLTEQSSGAWVRVSYENTAVPNEVSAPNAEGMVFRGDQQAFLLEQTINGKKQFDLYWAEPGTSTDQYGSEFYTYVLTSQGLSREDFLAWSQKLQQATPLIDPS